MPLWEIIIAVIFLIIGLIGGYIFLYNTPSPRFDWDPRPNIIEKTKKKKFIIGCIMIVIGLIVPLAMLILHNQKIIS